MADPTGNVTITLTPAVLTLFGIGSTIALAAGGAVIRFLWRLTQSVTELTSGLNHIVSVVDKGFTSVTTAQSETDRRVDTLATDVAEVRGMVAGMLK